MRRPLNYTSMDRDATDGIPIAAYPVSDLPDRAVTGERKHDQTLALSESWEPIGTAPFQTVIEVRNPLMDQPCLATRGYARDGVVHANTEFCTTVYTPDPDGLFHTPAGHLCCPTEWRPAEQPA